MLNKTNLSLYKKYKKNLLPSRHFTPNTQEWKESIYSFNKNISKTMPITHKQVYDLIKNYLSISALHNNKKSKHIDVRIKRLSLNKIHSSQPEMKHTNDKVTVTVYLYNKNKIFLLSKLKKIFNLPIKKKISKLLSNKMKTKMKTRLMRKKLILKYNLIKKQKYLNANKSLLIKNYVDANKENTIIFKSDLNELEYTSDNCDKVIVDILQKKLLNIKKRSLVKNSKFKGIRNITKDKNQKNKKMVYESLYSKKLTRLTSKSVILIKKVRNYKNFIIEMLKWNDDSFTEFENKYYTRFISKVHRKERLYIYYMKMLMFNNNKFKTWFILGLKEMLCKIYNKKIEFNFVNLKYLYLNSDILSESISVKVKNRRNKLVPVLKNALDLVTLSTVNKPNYYVKYLSNYVVSSDIFKSKKKKRDLWNNSLHILNLLLRTKFSKGFVNKDSAHVNYNNLIMKKPSILNSGQVGIFESIKHKHVLGVRLEGAGRLTKRLIASRSVYKARYKGSLRNLDSSVKGLSSVMLRGNMKSNIQYTKLSGKTRNGAFGLKGWVSAH